MRMLIWSLVLGASLVPGLAAAAQSDARAAGAAKAKGAEASEEIPEAMRHMVKGPDVDIESLRDPFQSYLALVASRGRQVLAERQARLANRQREPLEDFDLSTLKLVAIMKMGQQRVAMVEDPEGKGHIVRRGNYMGKNNGRVEKITDDSVYLVEQVVNPAGDIVDRQVTLTLKEVNE